MRLYLDTEFNGHGGELISMALVAESGCRHPALGQNAADAHFYEVCSWREQTAPWVAAHVVPKLGKSPMLPRAFRETFQGWVRHWQNPEIICDWHADAEHFCRLLAGADYGSSLDFACRITILKTPPGQPVSADPHNALADAIALRDWHQNLLLAA